MRHFSILTGLEERLAGSYSILRGSRADYPAIAALWEESVAATHHFLARSDFLAIGRELSSTFLPAVAEIWLCRLNGKLGGFCGNNGGHIEMLFVRPRLMRQGIGGRLLEHLASLHGSLTVEANEQNSGALAFYRHCGFIETGRSAYDGQGRPYPLIRLERPA